MDTKLRHTLRFELHRTDIAQGLMEPLPIVEHFDELEHRRLRVVARLRRKRGHAELLWCSAPTAAHRAVWSFPD